MDMKAKVKFGEKAMVAQITYPSGAPGEVWQGSLDWLWEKFNAEFQTSPGARCSVYDGVFGDDESLVAEWSF